jgi:serine/threonine protein kinase
MKSTTKFIGGHTLKLFHSNSKLVKLFKDKQRQVTAKSSAVERETKRTLNELLVTHYVASVRPDLVPEWTSVWYLAGDHPAQLEQSLISELTIKAATKTIPELFQGSQMISMDKILNGQIQVVADAIFVIVNKQLDGTLYQLLDKPNQKDLIIFVQYLINQIAEGLNIVHNDMKPENVVVEKYSGTVSLNFFGSKPFQLQVNPGWKLYLMNFEWAYCTSLVYGYTIIPPEYISDTSGKKIVPEIGSTDEVYYRGLEALSLSPGPRPLSSLLPGVQCPRVFTIDTLMLVSEYLKLGYTQADLYVIFNYYFTNYVRIATNELEPRYKNKISYHKVSAAAFAKDLATFYERIGI